MTEPMLRIDHDDARRFVNAVDTRWLASLRAGTLREDVKAAIGKPMTPTDLSLLLAPVGVALAEDSRAYEEFIQVMDELTGFCHPDHRMTDIEVESDLDLPTLAGAAIPVDDQALASLPTIQEWVDALRSQADNN